VPEPHEDSTGAPSRGLSRRGLLALSGGIGLAVGAAAGGAAATLSRPSVAGGADLVYPFFAEHQAGITTPAQDRLHFAAFTMRPGSSRADLIELLQDWTYAASRLTQGQDVSVRGAFDGGPYLPPDDTGEAADLPASGLTITFGFGRTLFVAADGTDRFGLAAQLPADFTELPTMVNDFIQPARSGGDLCIQACANDPQLSLIHISEPTRPY
jgi:deferrochelatase/peroxidase EfeB